MESVANYRTDDGNKAVSEHQGGSASGCQNAKEEVPPGSKKGTREEEEERTAVQGVR